MPRSRFSTRQRLLDTARELFVRQGITQTTTRQISDAAGVNEVTLFRHFSTKQGLLLAVFAELGVFAGSRDLQVRPLPESDLKQSLMNYVITCFQSLVNNPELVRSLVGEAGLYSNAHQQALQTGFSQAQQELANYLASTDSPDHALILTQASGVLHVLILGIAVLQVTAGLPPLIENSSIKESQGSLSESQIESQLELDPITQEWLERCVDLWLKGSGLDHPKLI